MTIGTWSRKRNDTNINCLKLNGGFLVHDCQSAWFWLLALKTRVVIFFSSGLGRDSMRRTIAACPHRKDHYLRPRTWFDKLLSFVHEMQKLITVSRSHHRWLVICVTRPHTKTRSRGSFVSSAIPDPRVIWCSFTYQRSQPADIMNCSTKDYSLMHINNLLDKSRSGPNY